MSVLAGIKHSAQADVEILRGEGENMETLRFQTAAALPMSRVSSLVPPSYFLIFPLRSNRFSLGRFAVREMSNALLAKAFGV